jgi:hypothetical protein
MKNRINNENKRFPIEKCRSPYFYSYGLIAAKYQPTTISFNEVCEVVLHYCHWISFIEWLWIHELKKSNVSTQKYRSELDVQINRIWEYRYYRKKK